LIAKKNKLLFIALKLLLVLLIMGWLIKEGKLTTDSFGFIFSDPTSFISIIFLIVFVSIPIVCLRWSIILKNMKSRKKSFFDIYKITLISHFFAIFMPGSATADLSKGYYLHNDNKNKTNIYFSIILDRVAGLYSIVLMIFFFYAVNYEVIQKLEMLNLFCNALIVGFIFSNLIALIFKNKILNSARNYKIKFLGYEISKIVDCILLLKIEVFTKALALSMLNQLVLIIIFMIIGISINNIGLADITNIALITPLGEISTMIPLFPIGIGIGHISFEGLYQLFDYKNGANIFNIFVSAKIIVGVIGGATYITYSRKL